MSLDQFQGLTAAQIELLAEAVDENLADLFEFEAAIHGRELNRKKRIKIDQNNAAVLEEVMRKKYEEARKKGQGHA